MSDFKKCDFCGQEIKGKYYKLNNVVNVLESEYSLSSRDVCDECVKFLKKAKGETDNEQ